MKTILLSNIIEYRSDATLICIGDPMVNIKNKKLSMNIMLEFQVTAEVFIPCLGVLNNILGT